MEAQIDKINLKKELSAFIFNAASIISIVIFAFLVLFSSNLGELLSPIVLFVTVLAVFSSFKLGFYGPYYLLIVLIPFSQSVTLFTLANRPVNIGMHTMVIGMIVLTTLLKNSFRIPTIKDDSIKTLIFLGIWTLVTIFTSITFAPASALSNSFVTWMRWVQFMPIAYLLVYNVEITKHFKKFVYLLIALGFIVSVWGVYETLNPTEFTMRAFRGAATFTKPLFRELDESASFSIKNSTSEGAWYMGSANYNIAGAFMAAVTLISIPFLTDKKTINKIPAGKIGILILIIGIAVTQSRSAIIAFILGLLVNSSSKSKKALLYTIFTIAFCGVIFFTFFSDYWLGPMLKETFNNLPQAISMVFKYGEYSQDMGFSVNVYGAAMRAIGIKEAFVGFTQAPVFGWGFFGFATYAPVLGTAENFYMQFLCETGAIGLLALLIYFKTIWTSTKTKFLKDSFASKYQRGFRSAFVALLIANVTGTLFYDTRIWGLMLVLSAIQIRLALDHHKNTEI